MVNEAIKKREALEADMGYTGPSTYLVVLREMLDKTEYEESVIYLKE
jgi:hypothetical protein